MIVDISSNNGQVVWSKVKPVVSGLKVVTSDLRGLKVNKLTALEFSHRKTGNNQWRYYWKCICDCGKEVVVDAYAFKSGRTKSCGCLNKLVGRHLVTHGLSKVYKNEYHIWINMIQRATNPNNPSFSSYGGRGITVCEAWKNFENFFRDMGKRPSVLHSIERRNNDLGYGPDNCSWELQEVQANNTRTNVFLSFKNKRQTISQWGKELGIKPSTLRGRITSGWSIERTLTTAVK